MAGALKDLPIAPTGSSNKLKSFDSGLRSGIDNFKKHAAAGLDVAGATARTVGKRIIGDDSPTELKPNTKKTLGIK